MLCLFLNDLCFFVFLFFVMFKVLYYMYGNFNLFVLKIRGCKLCCKNFIVINCIVVVESVKVKEGCCV